MTLKDTKILETLTKLAETHLGHGKAKVVAAIVYKGIFYFGFNSSKSHPFAARFKKHDEAIYLHAETAAIKHALRYLSLGELARSTLYIARARRLKPHCNTYITGLAKPCDGCARCIAEFNIKRVVYTE